MENNKIAESDKPAIVRKFGPTKRLSDKIKDAKEKLASIDPTQCKHRVAIILDDSGSTAGECWANEVKAVEQLLLSSNFEETSYLLQKLNEGLVSPLLCEYDKIKQKLPNFTSGGTPLARAMTLVLNFDITAAIIVSDGEADDRLTALERAEDFVKRGIKIDTVYVQSLSKDTEAMETLRTIAQKTGGIFMTFEDQEKFSKALAYLNPATRHLLEDKKVRLMLGSGE